MEPAEKTHQAETSQPKTTPTLRQLSEFLLWSVLLLNTARQRAFTRICSGRLALERRAVATIADIIFRMTG